MRTLMTILFALFASVAASQIVDDVYYGVINENRNFTYTPSGEESVEKNAAAIANVRYCLNQYRKERGWATAFSILGAGGMAGGLVLGDEYEEPGLIAGGALSLVGLFVYIDAGKWLKRAALEPTKEGATFIFKF